MTAGMFLPQRPQPMGRTQTFVHRSGPPMFLFCIGGAKCGSTWLYDYLHKHPDCYLRGNKELRYFNDVEDNRLPHAVERLTGRIATAEAKLSQMAPADRPAGIAELLDLRDYRRVLATCHQDKYAYFRYMMTGLRKERLVADVTPDYARVSAEMLGKMVGVANETKFVFVMRDPVARLWSHVRMETKRLLRQLPEGTDFATEVRATLARSLAGQEEIQVTRYSDYASTLAKMETVIPADRRLIMFYEDLMSPAGLRSFCKFVGIKHIKADFEKVVHLGRSTDMTDEERAAMRRYLQPQYEVVASRFPVLPKSWQKTMAEGFA